MCICTIFFTEKNDHVKSNRLMVNSRNRGKLQTGRGQNLAAKRRSERVNKRGGGGATWVWGVVRSCPSSALHRIHWDTIGIEQHFWFGLLVED